ncbi:MAG TPA: DNA polymerase III subunit chi [Gammaproteobacteria bacterium]|nr:DNA polymerase III subunit chi [Gammaproteobacteria bacterium]
MTKVDFYILKNTSAQQRDITACRLTEKAYTQGLRVYLHTANENHAQEMDKLLWSFRDRSFVPHSITDKTAPVTVGVDDNASMTQCDVLINLADKVPDCFSRFDRVLEIINADKTVRLQGRERFRFYRDRGYTLDTHEL